MVGRSYAGVMGLIAFVATIFRGVANGASLEATVTTSCGCMFAFAAVGFLVGMAGQVVVGDAVRTKFLAELSAREPAAAK